LRRAFAKGDFGEMATIAEPTVDDLAIAGTAEECRQRLAEYEGIVDRVIIGGAWIGPGQERIRENHEAIFETFAPRADITVSGQSGPTRG
ncbi:MAG: hypothetical protein ABR518_00450, partial [Actinomycetota bacterium]